MIARFIRDRPQGCLEMLDGLIEVAEVQHDEAEIGVRHGGSRVELERLLEVAQQGLLPLLELPHEALAGVVAAGSAGVATAGASPDRFAMPGATRTFGESEGPRSLGGVSGQSPV